MLGTQPWIRAVESNVSFPGLGLPTSLRCSASLSLIRPLLSQCRHLAHTSRSLNPSPSPSPSKNTSAGAAVALAPGTARTASPIDCVDHPSSHACARFPIHLPLRGRGGYRRCATQCLALHLIHLVRPTHRRIIQLQLGTAPCQKSCARRVLVPSPRRARGRRCLIARV